MVFQARRRTGQDASIPREGIGAHSGQGVRRVGVLRIQRDSWEARAAGAMAKHAFVGKMRLVSV
eukprot:1226505-Pleurochrysis_carterae.AAC.1